MLPAAYRWPPVVRSAHLTADADHVLVVGAALATARKQGHALSAPQPTTADGAARLEIGDMQGRADLSRETSRRTKAGPRIDSARTARAYPRPSESGAFGLIDQASGRSAIRPAPQLARSRFVAAVDRNPLGPRP